MTTPRRRGARRAGGRASDAQVRGLYRTAGFVPSTITQRDINRARRAGERGGGRAAARVVRGGGGGG